MANSLRRPSHHGLVAYFSQPLRRPKLTSVMLSGVGMGAKGSTVPILAAENSPANIRGVSSASKAAISRF